jgi:hypothetical protein
MTANIDYMAPNGAPDNDRKMKEASWLTGQAFIESLRYYPNGQTALDGHDSEATYSGCTHSARQVMSEHIETDVRVRLGIAPADQDWREDQVRAQTGCGARARRGVERPGTEGAARRRALPPPTPRGRHGRGARHAHRPPPPFPRIGEPTPFPLRERPAVPRWRWPCPFGSVS